MSILPWGNIDNCSNIDDALGVWYSLFIETVNKHAPIQQHRIKKDIQPEWLTSEILDSLKERDKLKKQGRVEEYKVLRNRKVQVGKDQEKAQSEKDSHSKNREGKKPN